MSSTENTCLLVISVELFCIGVLWEERTHFGHWFKRFLWSSFFPRLSVTFQHSRTPAVVLGKRLCPSSVSLSLSLMSLIAFLFRKLWTHQDPSLRALIPSSLWDSGVTLICFGVVVLGLAINKEVSAPLFEDEGQLRGWPAEGFWMCVD